MGKVEVTIPRGGLGTLRRCRSFLLSRLVTIPHGGLGTLNSPAILGRVPLGVTIPHGGLGTSNHHIN